MCPAVDGCFRGPTGGWGLPKGDVGEILGLRATSAVGAVEAVKAVGRRLTRAAPVRTDVFSEHGVTWARGRHDDWRVIKVLRTLDKGF